MKLTVCLQLVITITIMRTYQKAIESYFAIESDEHASAQYHNLGNCYYQKGDIPKSILFYERALLLKNDSQTHKNLNLAKIRIQEIESIPILFLFIGGIQFQFLNTNSLDDSYLYFCMDQLFFTLFIFEKSSKKQHLIFFSQQYFSLFY